MMDRKTRVTAALVAGLVMLAGCSRSEPAQPVPDNSGLEVTPETDASATPTAEASPVAEPTPGPVDNVMADIPPEQPVAPDAQVLEDADATGMTARVSRDAPPTANEQALQ